MSVNPIQGWGWIPTPDLPPTLNTRFLDLARFVKRILTGQRQASATVAAAYTVLPEDYLIRVDATAGVVTVTLPKAAEQKGRIVVIKKIDASANAVTIDANGAELIDGAATLATTTQYAAATLQSNGTSWDTLTHPITTADLGTGTADTTKFLRGDRTWSDTLAGPLNVDGELDVDVGAIRMGNQLLDENVARLVVYDDGTNASYLTYGVDAITRFKSTNAWLWKIVATGATRLTEAGTEVMRLSVAGALTLLSTVTATRFIGPATGLRETSGPTDLTVGAIVDGEMLKRVGGTIVSAAAGAGSTNITAVTLDFGAIPIKVKRFTVVDAAVLATSQIMVTAGSGVPSGQPWNATDEWEMDECDMAATPDPSGGSYYVNVASRDVGMRSRGALIGSRSINVLVG